jgi:hypothetical protein
MRNSFASQVLTQAVRTVDITPPPPDTATADPHVNRTDADAANPTAKDTAAEERGSMDFLDSAEHCNIG